MKIQNNDNHSIAKYPPLKREEKGSFRQKSEKLKQDMKHVLVSKVLKKVKKYKIQFAPRLFQ